MLYFSVLLARANMREHTKLHWRVKAVVSGALEDRARQLEQALNALAEEGYQASFESADGGWLVFGTLRQVERQGFDVVCLSDRATDEQIHAAVETLTAFMAGMPADKLSGFVQVLRARLPKDAAKRLSSILKEQGEDHERKCACGHGALLKHVAEQLVSADPNLS